MIKNEESLEDTLVEGSKNLHEVLDNSDVQNMVIKEEPLDESDNINETAKLQKKNTSFQPVTVKEEPLEESNQISETDQPMNVNVEQYDSIDIKMEIKEEIIDNDDDIPSDIDIIEDEGDDDIPSDIG